MKTIQSPLFVSTDSDSDSDGLDGDEFDSDSYDNDNDSIDSAALTPTEIEHETLSRRNTHIHLHLPNSPRSLKFRSLGKAERYSSTDPFAENYRKKADWDEATKARWQREWGFVTDFIEKYESVEHAEFTRPFDQFRVLIQVSSDLFSIRENTGNKSLDRNANISFSKERGLHEKYEKMFATSPDTATRSCNIMNMLLEEAPDLIARYAALEKLTRERVEVLERGGKAEWEVAWEKRRKAELGPWGTPRIR